MSNLSPSEKRELKKEQGEVLQQLEDSLETPMLLLGFGWLALLVVELIRGLNPLLEIISNVIWIVFILDFALRLVLAPYKFVYFKQNWLTALSLMLPALRVLRITRVLRLLRGSRGCDWCESLVL